MPRHPLPRLPRNWLITGASSHLGGLLAERVALQGDRVVLVGEERAPLEELAECYPGRVVPVVRDLAQPGAAEAVVRAALATERRVDVLVNAHCEALLAPLEASTDAEVRRIFEVNLFAPLALVRALLPVLRQQRAGHVVHVSSIYGFVGAAGFSAYSAARFALEGLSEALALELGPLGIHHTLVETGPLRTGWSARTLERSRAPEADYAASVGVARAYLESQRGRERGDPGAVAEAIVSAVDAPRPPLRLVLGQSAVQRVERKLHQVAAEMKAWAAVGRAVETLHLPLAAPDDEEGTG